MRSFNGDLTSSERFREGFPVEVMFHPRPEIKLKPLRGRGVTYQVEKNVEKDLLEEGVLLV